MIEIVILSKNLPRNPAAYKITRNTIEQLTELTSNLSFLFYIYYNTIHFRRAMELQHFYRTGSSGGRTDFYSNFPERWGLASW